MSFDVPGNSCLKKFKIFFDELLIERKKVVFLQFKKLKFLNKEIMYAIVEIAGQQFKVKQGDVLYCNRLNGEVESAITFDKVLLIDNEGNTRVGTPVLEGAKVDAKIIEHLKADKVLVFKKKRRKGYQKLNGHRQCLSKVRIENITE